MVTCGTGMRQPEAHVLTVLSRHCLKNDMPFSTANSSHCRSHSGWGMKSGGSPALQAEPQGEVQHAGLTCRDCPCSIPAATLTSLPSSQTCADAMTTRPLSRHQLVAMQGDMIEWCMWGLGCEVLMWHGSNCNGYASMPSPHPASSAAMVNRALQLWGHAGMHNATHFICVTPW